MFRMCGDSLLPMPNTAPIDFSPFEGRRHSFTCGPKWLTFMMRTERETEMDEKCVKTVTRLNSNWVKNFNEVARFRSERHQLQLPFFVCCKSPMATHELFDTLINVISRTEWSNDVSARFKQNYCNFIWLDAVCVALYITELQANRERQHSR